MRLEKWRGWEGRVPRRGEKESGRAERERERKEGRNGTERRSAMLLRRTQAGRIALTPS